VSDQLLRVCDLWRKERRGASGRPKPAYFVGAAGGLKVLLFERHDATEEGPHATLFVTSRAPMAPRGAAEPRQRATLGAAYQEDRREPRAPEGPPEPFFDDIDAAFADLTEERR
jgi:hypothetical protein